MVRCRATHRGIQSRNASDVWGMLLPCQTPQDRTGRLPQDAPGPHRPLAPRRLRTTHKPRAPSLAASYFASRAREVGLCMRTSAEGRTVRSWWQRERTFSPAERTFRPVSSVVFPRTATNDLASRYTGPLLVHSWRENLRKDCAAPAQAETERLRPRPHRGAAPGPATGARSAGGTAHKRTRRDAHR